MIQLCNEIVSLLKEKNLTLSCAESCTGGLIAKSITDVSGCSSVFYGGVVAYDNSVKMNILGVCEQTLNKFGAVSYETAKEMAQGVKSALKTDVGISTTGIAGPGGGTSEKPVGTVYIGFAYNGEVSSYLLSLPSTLSRDEIRHQTVLKILSLVKEKLS